MPDFSKQNSEEMLSVSLGENDFFGRMVAPNYEKADYVSP